MFPVFLAFVLFHGAEAPKIVAGYRTLDECFVAASKRNHNADQPWLTEMTGGYICLQMRGEV